MLHIFVFLDDIDESLCLATLIIEFGNVRKDVLLDISWMCRELFDKLHFLRIHM